jgi:nucleoside-diphosphate-sugar epimerase
MSEHLVLTGATGAIGVPLAARLLSRPRLERLTAIVRASSDAATLPAALKGLNSAADTTKLRAVIGNVMQADLGLRQRIDRPPITSVIHGAAFTKFKESGQEWAQVNVKGTWEVLRWRETNCPDARLIYFSTLCAAGKTVGTIPEAPLQKPEGFVNGYEASKWHAEQIVQGARGPVAILRLATVVGSQSDGSLRRVGAFHNVLRWVYRGLLPLIPGDPQTRVDLIPTEYVTEGVHRLLDAPFPSSPAFYHFSKGGSAIPLGELIDLCASRFSREGEAWKRGQFEAPVLASIPAFEEFRRSVVASRDLLFTQVLDSVDSFLPELFFPKQFSTNSTAALFGGDLPLSDWKEWMERVLDFSLRSDFGRHS